MIKRPYKAHAAFLQGPDCPENADAVSCVGVAAALQEVLEHTRKLEASSRMYHWNIVGSDFRRLHVMFEDEYKALVDDIDSIAEQIRQTGYFVECESLPKVDALRDGKNQIVAYRDMLRENVRIWKKVNAEAKQAQAIQAEDLSAEMLRKRSKSLYFFESLLAGNLTENQAVIAASHRFRREAMAARETEAGLDAMQFHEERTSAGFYEKLSACVPERLFNKVKSGLSTAATTIQKTYPKASVRFFVDEAMGGYIRVELDDEVYVVTYNDDLEDTGKVKVYTAQLNGNVPVNSFSLANFEKYAKTSTNDLPEGFMPVWLNG